MLQTAHITNTQSVLPEIGVPIPVIDSNSVMTYHLSHHTLFKGKHTETSHSYLFATFLHFQPFTTEWSECILITGGNGRICFTRGLIFHPLKAPVKSEMQQKFTPLVAFLRHLTKL